MGDWQDGCTGKMDAILEQFHFTFQHHSGKFHGNADALSRAPNPVFPVLHQLAVNLYTIRTTQAADTTLSDLMTNFGQIS